MRKMPGRLLAQELLQELGGIGHAVRAVTEDFPGSDTLEEPAPGGAVPLLELLHENLHPGAGLDAVFGVEAKDHPGPHKGSAGSFHIPHSGPVSPGDIQGGLLRKAYEVTVGTDYSLRAVMGIAALLFGRKVLSRFHSDYSVNFLPAPQALPTSSPTER